MKIEIVNPEIISTEEFEPTKHPRVFLNLKEGKVCIVGCKMAIEVTLNK